MYFGTDSKLKRLERIHSHKKWRMFHLFWYQNQVLISFQELQFSILIKTRSLGELVGYISEILEPIKTSKTGWPHSKLFTRNGLGPAVTPELCPELAWENGSLSGPKPGQQWP